jgi:signal transduction histidine kinase
MKPKLLLIFSLIVIIPTVTIICLGINLTKSEQTAIKAQISEINKQRLRDISTRISQLINEKEIAILPVTEIRTTDIGELRQICRKNPLINQIFILNDKRKLIYPAPQAKDLNSNEKAFLERSKETWESGETFDNDSNDKLVITPEADQSTVPQIGNPETLNIPQTELNDNDSTDNLADDNDLVFSDTQTDNLIEKQVQQIPNIYGSRQGNAEKSQIYPLQSTLPLEPRSDSVEPGSGWYTWFQGRGLHFILWNRNEANMLIGVELNRSRLISDIINSLPTNGITREQTIVLKSTSTNLYQWGNYKIGDGEEPREEISLLPPLQSWKLANYASPNVFGNLNKTMIFNYTVGGIILGILLVFLCVYFYLENNRQLLESSTKVNFVNQVSHELKTPLTNIRMYAELLQNRLSPEDAKSSKQLNIIVSESQRLSRLINNVLSFAQQEKNKITISKRDVSIDSILENVIEHFQPLLERKKITTSINRNANKKIKADKDALEQVIGNLLSNIEKYVPNNSKVEIETTQTDQWTTITISDNGPGIPANQQQRIFDAFHRISNKLSDGISGTGIGLSISRELALMHGGDLLLLNSETGAKFQLKLPSET